MNANQNELHSVKIRAGSRTYFLNVKEDKNGNLYLVIKESRQTVEGGPEAHRVMIFEDDFSKFVKGMQEALQFIKTTQTDRGQTVAKPRSEIYDDEQDVLNHNQANSADAVKIESNPDFASDINDIIS